MSDRIPNRKDRPENAMYNARRRLVFFFAPVMRKSRAKNMHRRSGSVVIIWFISNINNP
jgi:hypothetical protein